MQKKVLAVALAGLLLPALGLASQPLLVRFEGHTVPVRETVQVTHVPGGTVSVRTWSWRGPAGAGTVQVSESPGASAPLAGWALEQMMRALQMQMRQMGEIEAALQQPVSTPAIPVLWGEPLIRLSGFVPLLATGVLQPVVVPRLLIPQRVIVIEPAGVSTASPRAPGRHEGLRT